MVNTCFDLRSRAVSSSFLIGIITLDDFRVCLPALAHSVSQQHRERYPRDDIMRDHQGVTPEVFVVGDLLTGARHTHSPCRMSVMVCPLDWVQPHRRRHAPYGRAPSRFRIVQRMVDGES